MSNLMCISSPMTQPSYFLLTQLNTVLLAFNSEKWEVLKISRKKTTVIHYCILYGVVLKAVTHAKYLGVHPTENLKWNMQISEIVA